MNGIRNTIYFSFPKLFFVNSAIYPLYIKLWPSKAFAAGRLPFNQLLILPARWRYVTTVKSDTLLVESRNVSYRSKQCHLLDILWTLNLVKPFPSNLSALSLSLLQFIHARWRCKFWTSSFYVSHRKMAGFYITTISKGGKQKPFLLYVFDFSSI